MSDYRSGFGNVVCSLHAEEIAASGGYVENLLASDREAMVAKGETPFCQICLIAALPRGSKSSPPERCGVCGANPPVVIVANVEEATAFYSCESCAAAAEVTDGNSAPESGLLVVRRLPCPVSQFRDAY